MPTNLMTCPQSSPAEGEILDLTPSIPLGDQKMSIARRIGVCDSQFLRSMIPHHSGAILMCEGASISEPEIQRLCQAIVTSQQEEIDLMIRLLNR